MDRCVVCQVLVLRDQCDTVVVLETNTFPLIQAVKVLDSGDDRISNIVWSDTDSQGKACSVLRSIGQQKLKIDCLWWLPCGV